jgi:toxin ParE1/3/4
MSGKFVLSFAAENDLTNLFDYIAEESGVDRAEMVLRRIEQTLQILSSWPLIGRTWDDLENGSRVFALWPWLIFYEPTASGILVWRVLDGRRDIPKIINDSED